MAYQSDILLRAATKPSYNHNHMKHENTYLLLK